jgi:hypothetical protein
MKLFIAILICSLPHLGNTQNNEISFNYGIGIAINKLRIVDPTFENNTFENQYSHMKAKSQYDHGATILYKRSIFKKLKLFATAGVELSSSKHYQELIDPYERHLENIRLTSNRIAFHLGLNKQFEFYDSKVILDLGCHIVDRYALNKTKSYATGFHYNNEDWIEYKYDLTTYHGKYYENDGVVESKAYMYLNLDFSATLMLELSTNMYLNLGVSYSRNNVFFYDYSYEINYYYNGSTIPSETQTFEGLQGDFDPKFGMRDHYLYFETGLSYKFGR